MLFRRKAFLRKLKKETPQWVSGGIIDPAQQEKILELYAAKKVDVAKRVPAIIMGLATVLLCVGLVLFYAANWRRIPPPFKLVQVFGLILGTYSTSYLLALRETHERLSRVFLMMGMVSFGIGIALIAQIYHISAHPSNGILIWSLGTLVTSWVTREKWGYYLTAFLIFIWNGWEYFQYNNPNYGFPILALVLLYFFHQNQERIGAILVTFELIFWFYQINIYKLVSLSESEAATLAFLLLHVPLGVVMVCLGRLGEEDATLFLSSKIIMFLGWISIFLPLIGLSWPFDFQSSFPFFMQESFFVTLEYLILTGLAGGLLYSLNKRGIEYRMLAVCMAYGLLVFFLPMGHKTTLMITTHLGLLAFFFGILYSSYTNFSNRRLERFLAFALPILTLLVKGVGFLGYGLSDQHFLVAYGLGFIIFGTVCFLINQSVKFLVNAQGKDFPANLLNAVCALTGFWMIYVLSFQLPEQGSVFSVDPIVLIMIFLFLAIALGLYLFLWLKSPDRLILILSGVIFFSCVGVLLISGPDISWVLYSLIFNFLLFGMVATLIYYSTQINSVALANLAIAGFLLHVITRYFDLLWDLLSGSLLFIVTGFLALGGGYALEKNRRKLLATIRKSGGSR